MTLEAGRLGHPGPGKLQPEAAQMKQYMDRLCSSMGFEKT
jgi:hypothetical protein